MPREPRLVLYSAAEEAYCAALLAGYRARHPGVDVEFVFGISTALHARYLAETAAGQPSADVLWSSAMDLQMTLVASGQALPYRSREAEALPAGAVYRDLAYATTIEPLFTLIDRRQFDSRVPAGSPGEIATAIEADPGRFRGRIAAYDIARNGLGFLALLAEGRRESGFERFLNALSGSGPKAFGSTPPLVEEVASGRAALAYHVLGSYAERAVRAHPSLAIATTRSPWLAVSRIVLIPRNARNPDAAKSFVDYLLSEDGQEQLAAGGFPALRGRGVASVAVEPIRLMEDFPELLDEGRRQALLARWRSFAKPA